jgi:hypothetical protein
MSNFPNIARYYAAVQARDHGLALCVLIAMIVLGLLINVRVRWPEKAERFMQAFVAVYYLSMIALFILQWFKKG